MFIAKPAASLIWITPEPLEKIEAAGRLCYKSESKQTADSAEQFVQKLIKRGHESVLEHASASFLLICDRGVSHELVRHRIASYSQESTRYCNYGSDRFGREIAVVQPPGLTAEQYLIWEHAMQIAEQSYLSLLDAGQSAQIARAVLPTCLKTEICVTTNMREWRHLLKLRLDKAAHPQMREIAALIASELRKHVAPLLVDIEEQLTN